MCGIAGGFAFKESGNKFLTAIKKAIQCINHRGPDGDGIFSDETVALGHKRLSIIDISESANQPMFSADKRYCIVFNGEIFNYTELSSRYLADQKLCTSSDTEVFVELFAKMGSQCFKFLRGFYAAAIYDHKEKQLYVVRDRFGKKPLHFFKDDNIILFSSELRSLLAFGVPKEVDYEILPFYFQLNYLPQPFSFLKNIQKLNPGHYLKINKDGVESHSYYELRVRTESYGQYAYGEAMSQLKQLLDEATRVRLIADVPLGAFLSGGIDSSVIVALASRYRQQLNTFSVGYKDHPFFDETHYADLVARRFNTHHTVFHLGNNDFLEHIDDMLTSIDEPFADSSAIPTFILSKYTRKHVTVALSGDGGDEVFGGYNKHKAEWNAMQPSLKKALVKGLKPLWEILPKSRNHKLTNKIRQLHRFAEGTGLSAEDRYWKWASLMSVQNSLELLHGGKQRQSYKEELSQLLNVSISGNDINEVLLADMKLVLVGDMLVKVDMMSMANSLEIRSPFLDQEVVEFAFGLPAHFKIDRQMKKKIVQDSFRDILPIELYNRPKQGFDIPLLGWFRKELWGLIDNDLLSDRFIKEQDIFNLQAVQNLKRKLFSSNPEDTHEHIWALIVFQHWWKTNIA